MPVHVREMGAGANAIDAAYRVIGELRQLEADWNDAQGRPRALRERGASDQPQYRQDRRRRLGLVGAGLVPDRLPHRDLSGRSAAEAAREIEQAVAAFARTDRFLANNPPHVTFNGFHAEGYVLEPGSEAEAVLARRTRPRPASRSRAS